MKYIIGILLLVFLVAIIVVIYDNLTTMSAEKMNKMLSHRLQVGDSKEKIESVLSENKLGRSFDSFQMRYYSIIRDPSNIRSRKRS